MKLLAFAFLTLAGFPLAVRDATIAEPIALTLDSAHSSVMFRISRGVVPFYGRFDRIEGELQYAKDTGTIESVTLRIAADSVHTGNDRRDQHLKSPDFFDVEQFPTITFTSTAVEPAGDDTFKVQGELDLHGVKQPVEAKVVRTGTSEERGLQVGFDVELTLNRVEFGMEYGRDSLGDEVLVRLGVLAQPPRRR